MRGLILGAGMALVLVAIMALTRRQINGAIAAAAVAALAFFTYAAVEDDQQPVRVHHPVRGHVGRGDDLRQAAAPPAAEGIPYFKGQQL